MKTHSGVAATLFQALADAGINIDLISTSEIKISVVVDLDRADEAVRVAHAAFGLDKAVGRRRAHALRLDTGRDPARGLLGGRGRGPGAGRRALRARGAARLLARTWRLRRALPIAELCFRFLRRFATDIPEPELRELVARSYAGFDRPEIAPLLELSDGRRMSSSSSTGRPSPSRISPSSSWATSTRSSARSAGRRSTSWAPPRATPARRRSTASWASRAPRSSSSIPTGGSRRCRSARWPARARPTSTRSPSTAPSTTRRRS